MNKLHFVCKADTLFGVMYRGVGVLACAVVSLGCSSPGKPCSGGPPEPIPLADAGAQSDRLLPLNVGASWTYRTTDTSAGTTTSATTRVVSFGAIGGDKPDVMAFRLETPSEYGNKTVEWYEDRGGAIVKHLEQAVDADGADYGDQIFMPYRLVVDERAEHTAANASYSEEFTQIEADTGGRHSSCEGDAWTFEATDEQITVPAGSFACVRIRRVADGGKEKTFWFSRGIGKIKEQASTGKVVELTAFTPGP